MAFLELARLDNLMVYGTASAQMHAIAQELGAVPIDYRKEDFVAKIKKFEPAGIDIVFDGLEWQSFKRPFKVIKPPVWKRMPLAQARQAHELIEAGKPQGKIVLEVD